jgi:hypothetical protein
MTSLKPLFFDRFMISGVVQAETSDGAFDGFPRSDVREAVANPGPDDLHAVLSQLRNEGSCCSSFIRSTPTTFTPTITFLVA